MMPLVAALTEHCALCDKCNEYGPCQQALAMLGEMAGMRKDVTQPLLFDTTLPDDITTKPLVRMYLRDCYRRKGIKP